MGESDSTVLWRKLHTTLVGYGLQKPTNVDGSVDKYRILDEESIN